METPFMGHHSVQLSVRSWKFKIWGKKRGILKQNKGQNQAKYGACILESKENAYFEKKHV